MGASNREGGPAADARRTKGGRRAFSSHLVVPLTPPPAEPQSCGQPGRVGPWSQRRTSSR